MEKIMDRFETVAAVIPCYNEASNISMVVKETRKHADLVIVVSDHSTDATELEALKAGATVINNTSALKGVGIATKIGIQAALKAKAGIIVTLDGDGQHDPAEIPLLINKMCKESADIVVGTRKLQWKKMPGYRRFGNNIINFTFNAGNSGKTSDSMSGFRAYRRHVLLNIDFEENGFEYVPEVLLKAGRLAAWVVEVPISCVYHGNFAMNSSMRPVEHGLRMVYTILKWRLALAGSGSRCKEAPAHQPLSYQASEAPAQQSINYQASEALPELETANRR
jgi:glycosyltransferase involved in cell wall biosynthesis